MGKEFSRVFCLAAALGACALARAQWPYPPTRTVDASDTYFGVTYRDPYRWLEDLKSPEVEAWFKAQAALTDGLLAKIPGRDALARQWMDLDKLHPATYGDILYENGRVFYKKTRGGENVGKLYWRQGWTGAEQLLFDPSTYKAGVVTTIETVVPSCDGRHVVVGLSAGGAEYSELRVIAVDGGALLPESIYPSYGANGWTLDNRAFFYDAGKVTDIKAMGIEENRKTRIHRLGTPVAADPDFFSDEADPELGIAPKEFPEASVDESYPRYIFGNVSTVQNEMRVFYAPAAELGAPQVKWNVLCQPSDNLVRGMECAGDYVYAVTHQGAPHYKLVRTLVAHPDWKHAETVIPEAADSIQTLSKSRHYLFLVYSNGVVCRVVRYDLATGRTSPVALPGSGTVALSCPDWRSDRCIVSITSWIAPTTLYDGDGRTGVFTKSIFNTDVTYPGFDQLTIEEVEVPGWDGAMIPLSIIHRQDLKRDGNHSCILEGYGAYGISYSPFFSVRRSVALQGVVVAYAHPRGGSEKGESWYKAGYQTTKPNTWKDFISCAQYLEDQGYTRADRMAGVGTSAGGILISRAIETRPDLFAAAVCNVGCANAMRMEFSPNGPANIPEFGTVKDPVQCRALYEMDGVQHVRAGVKYPAVLCVGGWNDPRVEPWEPGKFAAALQNATASDKPVLLKINYDNGHFTEEKRVTFKNFAGQFAFLLWQTGHPDYQPRP